MAQPHRIVDVGRRIGAFGVARWSSRSRRDAVRGGRGRAARRRVRPRRRLRDRCRASRCLRGATGPGCARVGRCTGGQGGGRALPRRLRGGGTGMDPLRHPPVPGVGVPRVCGARGVVLRGLERGCPAVGRGPVDAGPVGGAVAARLPRLRPRRAAVRARPVQRARALRTRPRTGRRRRRDVHRRGRSCRRGGVSRPRRRCTACRGGLRRPARGMARQRSADAAVDHGARCRRTAARPGPDRRGRPAHRVCRSRPRRGLRHTQR